MTELQSSKYLFFFHIGEKIIFGGIHKMLNAILFFKNGIFP